MQHYFGQIEDGYVSLPEDARHHLLVVKRANVGEEIEISASERLYSCVVESVNPLRIKVIREIEIPRELNIELILGFALLKGDHNELVVLKATEMGASVFYPFTSKRTIVTPKGKEDNKLLRLRKIAQEGAEQCRRNKVPEVKPYATYGELLSLDADVKLLAYEGMAGESASILSLKEKITPGKRVLLLIGPEGGFSDEEVEKALKQGFELVSLGRRILRAETASLYGVALLSALAEED